jgi:ABC-type transport system involved in multi-copper enzyme maturation permease subunit
MFGRIWAIASNTRKEAYRNKAFVVLGVLGLLLVASGGLLAALAVRTQKAKVVQDFGYFAVSIVTVLTAILIGVILLYKELDKKTIYSLISKPVARFEIVLGKFFGLAIILVMLTAFLGLCWLALIWIMDAGFDIEAATVHGEPIIAQCLISLCLMTMEALLITAVAIMFSSWTRPFLSGMFTFGYFLMGRWVFLIVEHLQAKKGALSEPGVLRFFGQLYTYVVPDLQLFNVSRELALGIEVPAGYALASLGYAAAFSTVFLMIAIFLFSRRDFV